MWTAAPLAVASYTPGVLGRWVTHALIYLSACSTLSFVWVLLTPGTIDDLRSYAATPGDALTLAFWPVWAWLIWGTAVAFHGAVVLGRLVPGRRHRGHRPRRRPDGGGARRFVVAMFTDLTGSTTANERLGDERWAALVADHRQVVRAATRDHRGREVGTQGDGFFVRFDDPARATACAVDLQRRCRSHRDAGIPLPPVRIGIHMGDAVHDDDDVIGQVVNVAARLLDAAAPGEILLTEPVADAVMAHRLDDRGLVPLKGLAQPRHLLALRWDDD